MPVRSPSLVVLLGCLAAGACASSRAVPRPFPAPRTTGVKSPGVANGSALAAANRALVADALQLQGVRYRDGGSDPGGFDCSGFVWYVFSRQGIAVPRTVASQFQTGARVRPDALRPGDLVFFHTGSSPASHVGMVVGTDLFVHAPSSHGVVRTERLSAPYWASRYVGARRLT